MHAHFDRNVALASLEFAWIFLHLWVYAISTDKMPQILDLRFEVYIFGGLELPLTAFGLPRGRHFHGHSPGLGAFPR